MSLKKVALTFVWTVVWPATVLVALLSMAGDPVEGGYEQRQLFGRSILVVGAVILAAGYWIIFRKRSR